MNLKALKPHEPQTAVRIISQYTIYWHIVYTLSLQQQL